MTRGKWVALAVVLAVLAVLVPYGPVLWRAVAYDRQEAEGLLQDGDRWVYPSGGE